MPRKPAPPARSTGTAGRKSVPLNLVAARPESRRRKPYGEGEEVQPEEDLEDFDDDELEDDDVEDIDDDEVEDFEDEDFDDDEVDDFSDDDDE
jgi:ribosome assembly protein YihI (activator of Der GTPase)